jgi:hypothetical protein
MYVTEMVFIKDGVKFSIHNYENDLRIRTKEKKWFIMRDGTVFNNWDDWNNYSVTNNNENDEALSGDSSGDHETLFDW